MESDNSEESKTARNKKRLLEALEKSLGIVNDACKRAKISRGSYYKWIESDSEFKAAVRDIKEIQKDFVESMFLQNIRKKKEVSIIFYLKTQCKDRGYSEKQELVHDFHSNFSGFTVTIKEKHD